MTVFARRLVFFAMGTSHTYSIQSPSEHTKDLGMEYSFKHPVCHHHLQKIGVFK